METDSDLLRQYAEHNCQEAFAEIVARHLNLVYSAALRQVNGDRHLAQDVAQTVFTDLARKAGRLLDRPSLTAWLYRSTHFAAAKAVRSEQRRRAHQEEANHMCELLGQPEPGPDWAQLQPVLDEVMHELDERDRELVLMRYFENSRLAEIGARLGLSEDAARKRVDRALDKLEGLLLRRGFGNTAALGALLSSWGVQAAPAGLAATIAHSSLAGMAVAGGTGAVALRALSLTKAKLALAGALLVIGVAAPLILEQKRADLARENQDLRAQVERQQLELANLQRPEKAQTDPNLSPAEVRELMALRGEVGRLRRDLANAERARANSSARTDASGSRPEDSAAPRAPASAAFQVRLVRDQEGENTETITNLARLDDAAGSAEMLHVQKDSLVDSASIQSADVITDPATGSAQIQIVLTDQGRELFARATKEHLNERLAIVMDGQSYLAPTIRSEITGGRIQLTGTFTEQQARALTAKINEAVAPAHH